MQREEELSGKDQDSVRLPEVRLSITEMAGEVPGLRGMEHHV